jgi:putative DNA primase/helicase
VILPDNDQPGERHALHVAQSLLPAAATVKVVRLPGLGLVKLKHGEDVSDWLDYGHTKEELAELVEKAEAWQPESPKTEPTPLSQGNEPILVRISDVVPRCVQWLWPGRIPLGKITILDGDPGEAKSTTSLDLAARVSTVRPMPDGTASDLSEPAGIVLLSAEDDEEDTIRLRLEVAGADLERIVKIRAIRDSQGEHFPSLFDLDAIRQAIETIVAKLLIVDPLMAYLPATCNAFRDQDIRRALASLAALAAETGVAVLVIRHLNKNEGGKALYRGGGSIGIIGAARSGLLAAKDPDDEERHILTVTKSNLAKIPPSLAYRIGVTDADVTYIIWEGQSGQTAATLLAQSADGEGRPALEEAKEFLREELIRVLPN